MALPPQLLALGPVFVFLHTLTFPYAFWFAIPFTITTFAYIEQSPFLPTWINYCGFILEILYILHFNTARSLHRTQELLITAVATVLKLSLLTFALTFHSNAIMITAWVASFLIWILLSFYPAFNLPPPKEAEKPDSPFANVHATQNNHNGNFAL